MPLANLINKKVDETKRDFLKAGGYAVLYSLIPKQLLSQEEQKQEVYIEPRIQLTPDTKLPVELDANTHPQAILKGYRYYTLVNTIPLKKRYFLFDGVEGEDRDDYFYKGVELKISEPEKEQYNTLVQVLRNLRTDAEKITAAYNLIPAEYEWTRPEQSEVEHTKIFDSISTDYHDSQLTKLQADNINTIYKKKFISSLTERHPYTTITDGSKPGVCEDKAYALARLLYDIGFREVFVMHGKQVDSKNTPPLYTGGNHSWVMLNYEEDGKQKTIQLDRTNYEKFCAVDRRFLIYNDQKYNPEEYQPFGYKRLK